jgi:hypothetical protein
MCLIVVPLPPAETPFSVKINNNNNNNNNKNKNKNNNKNVETCDIQTWKKSLFLNISSTNIDHLSYCFTSASKLAARSLLDVVSATSAPPFHHLRLSNAL